MEGISSERNELEAKFIFQINYCKLEERSKSSYILYVHYGIQKGIAHIYHRVRPLAWAHS